MSKLTNTESRRKKKQKPSLSKEFENSQLAQVFGNLTASEIQENKTSKVTNEKKIEEAVQETETPVIEEVTVPKEETTTINRNEEILPDLSNLPKREPQKVETPSPTDDEKNKSNSRQKKTRKGLPLNDDGTYKLGQSTLYNRILTVSKSLSVREDVLEILKASTTDDKGSNIQGLKAKIVSNGIMKELAELGFLDPEEVKRELYEYK